MNLRARMNWCLTLWKTNRMAEIQGVCGILFREWSLSKPCERIPRNESKTTKPLIQTSLDHFGPKCHTTGKVTIIQLNHTWRALSRVRSHTLTWVPFLEWEQTPQEQRRSPICRTNCTSIKQSTTLIVDFFSSLWYFHLLLKNLTTRSLFQLRQLSV